ncbi:ROK family glucokinase [Candidatus Xianfuyuplasma coldseepsis]|uniref:Glucokinase n=1 Tax=Candidatus Xianfuyuplasma coldseepsis TaxID=2782163 RepID=A0A7L7KSY1_9MOLU|nr:ROK family glucokinase [Xianfuyuplasma coldseepsis]QMS85921.1 ROK family glucokinase [Xianfuyuplasma coldseepsis]
MKPYVYGIDIGGTSIKFGLFNRQLQLEKKWEIPTNSSNNGESIFGDIVDSIKMHTPDLSQIEGYGFGVPGPVLKNYVQMCVNLGWKNVDLQDRLRDELKNDHIVVGNDANVAALGEAFLGAAKGRKNVAMLTLGTGVGSGIVVDGRLLEGHNGSAGELGHLTIPQEQPIACNCGKKGCLETVASATGIRNIYHRLNEDFTGHSTLYDNDYVDSKAIFDAAKAGDKLAISVVDEAAYYIGYACHVLSVTTDPSVIVIGGGVSKAGEFLIEKVTNEFHRLVFQPTNDTVIVTAQLGNDAGIYGAAGLVKIRG